MDDESKICRDLAMIWGVDQAEIAKIVHDYIERDIGCNYDIFNSPPPPIYIGPVKVKTLKERLEEYKMKKATSVQNIKNVKDVILSIENNPIEMGSKLTIVASTDDDIFKFEFEGTDLLQICKRAGLFAGWEKDIKIRELEKENKTKCENCLAGASYEEMYRNLRERMKKEYENKIKELEKELGEWKKEVADCLRLRDEIGREKNREINKLHQQLQQAEHDKKSLTWKNEQLTQENEKLKELKTPTIENFADEEGHSDQPKADNVNHPSHYETGKFECIEVMQEVFGIMAVCDFCKCNAFKYIYRMDRKNGDEDVRKAIWYLNKYLELSEKIDIYKEIGGLIPRPEFVKDGGTDDGRKKQVPEGE